MRTLLVGLALGALVLLGSAAAQAGSLVAATFSLTLTGLPPASFTATFTAGGGASTGLAGSSAATWSVAPNAVPGGIASASINSNAAPPLTWIQIVVNSNPATGSFTHTVGGPMLITGVANVWGLGGFPAGGPPLLGIPLALGAPGTVMAGGFGVFITAFANAWTTKSTAISLTTPTANGATTGMVTGAFTSAGGFQNIILVSAVNVMTSIAGQVPTFAVLTLKYVPEPGMLVMIGVGSAGLALLGRRKTRK